MAAQQLTELKQRQATQAGPAPMQLPTFQAGGYDLDVWHAMQARDVQLIEDQVLHGRASKEFVYEFEIQGKKIRGISVVGARELAATYGGIKSRIIASADKTGDLFVFKTFEPLQIQASIIPQLAGEEDFYEVVMEVTDIKSGNSIQVRKKESKVEKRRDGTPYVRPHYDVIAESKAFRNGVLSILSQSLLGAFEDRCLKAGNIGGEKTLQQLQSACLRYATKQGISLERTALLQLTYEQIRGLEDAAAEGKDVFAAAAMRAQVTLTTQGPEQALPEQPSEARVQEEPPAKPKLQGIPPAAAELE